MRHPYTPLLAHIAMPPCMQVLPAAGATDAARDRRRGRCPSDALPVCSLLACICSCQRIRHSLSTETKQGSNKKVVSDTAIPAANHHSRRCRS